MTEVSTVDIMEDETALQKYERMSNRYALVTHQRYEKEMISKFDSSEEPDILIVVSISF